MTRSVLIVAFPDAEMLDIACPSDVLHAANGHGALPPYRIRLASLGGQPVRCSSGLVLAAQTALERVDEPLDTLLVAGGVGHEAAAGESRFVAHVRRLAARSRRVASVCTGATVLAAAGLLNGRKATTHWRYADWLARRFPEVAVDPAPLYVRDGNVYTGAGVTSGLDLTLALVEEDHGPSLTREIARTLVTYLQRPGSQAQVSMFLAPPPPERRVVADLAAHIRGQPDADHSTPTLAVRAGLSVRHLTRLFREHLGRPPGRFVREVRTEAASHLLTTTDLTLAAIARRCGFGSTETLRQAFLEQYGTPPSTYRRARRARVLG